MHDRRVDDGFSDRSRKTTSATDKPRPAIAARRTIRSDSDALHDANLVRRSGDSHQRYDSTRPSVTARLRAGTRRLPIPLPIL